MTFTVHFKTPDVMDQLDDDYVSPEDLDKMQKFAAKFVEYGENIVVEFDTEAGTATVRPVK
jgi:hypothetical protein